MTIETQLRVFDFSPPYTRRKVIPHFRSQDAANHTIPPLDTYVLSLVDCT